MCAACISSINQHCFEREKGMLIKQSKKHCKCSKTVGSDCTLCGLPLTSSETVQIPIGRGFSRIQDLSSFNLILLLYSPSPNSRGAY